MEHSGNQENLQSDSPLFQELYGMRESSSPILQLCRRYLVLAISAIAIFAICVGLNSWLVQQLSGENRETIEKVIQNLSHLIDFNIALNWLGLLLLIIAVWYGFRIARQARIDAQRNEKFLQDAKQRTLEIAALYDTTQDVSVRHELTPLLQNILERATSLLQGDGAAIFLYDEEHNDFQIAVERGAGMPIGAHLPLHEGLGGEVARTFMPVIVNDYANWQNRARNLKELPIRATVCVPMIRGGELIGVLGVHEVRGEHETTDENRMFTEADAKLLSLFADNAAGAVHNARLLEELRRSEERFRIAAEIVSDLVYDRDLVSDTARFFRAQYESLWASVGKLTGTMDDFRNSIHPEDRERVLVALQKHLESGTPFSEEYRITVRDSVMNVSDRAIAIRDHDGKPVRLVGSMSDITERKRAEQLKSDFTSFVTHQLRTPLSGVKWMLELAIDAKDDMEEMRSFVQDARLSTDRLIRLVNDLLDVSRLEGGRLKITLQPVDLGELTKEVAAELTPQLLEMRHRLNMHITTDLPQLDCDQQLLRQAIMNLLSNAVKYTPTEGTIDIRVTSEPDGLRWEIRDTGIGIPQKNQNKLFAKFYRADNVQAVETEGTGLGLYLVRLIVEQFGGKVWCESIEGAGSTFIFIIPKTATTAAQEV